MFARFLMLLIPITCSYGLLQADSSQPDDALTTEIVANDHSSIWDLITKHGYSGLGLEGFDPDQTEENIVDDSMWFNQEKIYLNPERIIPTDQGLFLNLNDRDYIALPMVYSDECGCYIKPLFNTNITSICPNCGWQYLAICKNPNCPGKDKQKKLDQEKKDKKKNYKEKKDKKKQ